MPSKTPHYQLDYFKQGSYYSSLSDLRRFVTLDYNMESYIGFAGVGILSGWSIEQVSGLTIQITPGKGIINGYLAESPYVIKQRSAMITGEREVEIFDENDVPEDPLTPAQRVIYVAIIQAYNPSYNPVGDIVNAYVKVVTPYSITLSNNVDTYIYAQRPSGAKPYPTLSDYPPSAGIPPSRSNYNTYDDYLVALNIYNAKITAIHNYEWYNSSSNHFTEVQFVTSSSLSVSSNKILLARVVTRSSTVSKIDVSQVNNLSNFQSAIRQFALEYLVEHQHGGSKPFDPPKIKLETYIRDTSLYKYVSDNNHVVYNVLESDETSIEMGHKHTYTIDGDGNGQTIEQIGSTNPHFHKISEFVVGDPEYSINGVSDHIHTIDSTEDTTWDSTSRFVVYVNDELFGDETTSYIHADSENKRISFDKGINASNSKYSCNFTITLLNPVNGSSELKSYSYEGRYVSVYDFMLHMMLDYNNTFSDYYQEVGIDEESDLTGTTNIGFITTNISNHPFTFYNSDGSIYGLQDLKSQSSSAQSLLKKSGDSFTFTPNAARNITISLVEVGYVDNVKIEILGNTEVTGKLKSDNVLYLNANKILTGTFETAIIPFISHAGRIREECLPLQHSLISNDGIRYFATPTITDSKLGHYHKLEVNKKDTGITTDVLIDNDPVYYESDNTNTYFIYHSHSVIEKSVGNSESNGLLNWQNNVYSTNLTSSVHTHNIIEPIVGDAKTIYAIREDIQGNVYLGTSNGLIVIPSDPAYEFVINGSIYYFYGDDLWTLLIKAKNQYEKDTENPLPITENVYSEQVTEAISVLTSDGESVLLTGTVYPDRPTDNIMIKRVSSFNLPNFYYRATKVQDEVLDTETIIGTAQSNVNGQIVSNYIVERNYNDTPIWSLEIRSNVSPGQSYIATTLSTDVFAAGSNLIVKSIGQNKSSYQPWSFIILPFAVNVIRKMIKDADGNYWICTNNGIFVSRSYSDGNIFAITSIPYGNPDVSDIINGEKGAIYGCSSSGIFKTIDGGKTWSQLYDVIGGFKQLARDRTLDKSTTVSGHYHNLSVNNNGDGFLSESIGSGTPHVHVMTSWTVAETMGHTHTLLVTLYAVDNSKIIWKSINNGITWTQYGLLPDGECSDIFAAFGNIYLSQSDGLYKSGNGSTWARISNSRIYSYEWSYDMSELLMGSDNILYGTLDGTSLSPIYVFGGSAASIITKNGSLNYYGYAYSNLAQSFHFKSMVLDEGIIAGLIDFRKWYAEGGKWDNSTLYDVYVNYKRVLSTKYDENKQSTYGYYFEVVPAQGLIDFGNETALISNVSIFDKTVEVSNSVGFYANDEVYIHSNSSSVYATIESVSSGEITLTSNIDKNISLPAIVKKIPNVNGYSSVLVNVYNDLLSNIGILTHEQIEDYLSNYSDGRPYKFNDTYLSNLLQLTQAIRYVYPNINSEFINDMFYDFRYSWSPIDPLYPSIYDYIDVISSETYNQKSYDSNFVPKYAKSINKILIGYGSFANTIIVATDIGIFYARLTASYEANWFYVYALPYSVFDIMIFSNNTLFAATSNGTYRTSDLTTWTLEESPAISYPSYALGLRWFNGSKVVVSSHSAEFEIPVPNTYGTITALSGVPYKNLVSGQGIKITGAGSKNGNYIIQSIGDNGTGYGSKMTVEPGFSGSTEIKNTVVITMGTWWSQWNGDINTSNTDITNTLLVGGKSHISYNDGGDVGSWHESSFTGISNFVSRKFHSLSNGRSLLSASGTSESVQNNYIMKSDDIGKNWDLLRQFSEVKGTILSAEATDFNNTLIKVSYTQPSGYIYVNGNLDQQTIAVLPSNSATPLFTGKIILNEKGDNDTITVFGNSLYSLDISGLSFIVYPMQINTLTESYKETLLFGTDKGLYYDINTVVSNQYPEGTIMTSGYDGIVEKIDISGTIMSIGINGSTGNSVLRVTSDTIVRGNELNGKYVYVTDAYPVEKYEIVANYSETPGNEWYMEIKAALLESYVGKKFKVIGNYSRAYINFDLPVTIDQFKNGTLVVSSNEYLNRGTSYNIVSNNVNYVNLKEVLIPTSTLVLRNEEVVTATSKPLQSGQNVKLIDSSGKMTLWVSLNRSFKENALKDLTLSVSDEDVPDVAIVSNWKNSITLNSNSVLSYSNGNSFVLKGMAFEQLNGFSHLKTSVDSGHYHNVDTVNAMVSGEIQSFSNVGASYVDIVVTNTENFNIPIVQLQGDLFHDAQIVFTSSKNINLRYVSDVVSHTATYIRVRIKDPSYWNFVAADDLKVSSGWNWEIDGTNYGYTSGTVYDDFAVLSSGIISTASKGAYIVRVKSSSGMLVGDKVKIQDDTLSSEINYISNVIDATTIRVSTPLSKTYLNKSNPQIKVLRDTFANTHRHQIRSNESENLLISAYLNRGYPAEHSHRVLPLISEVSTLLNRNNDVLVFGSGSKVYDSSDNGDTWQEVVDLNNFLEGDVEVQGISTAILNNNNIIVGATNGSLFAQADDKSIVALNNPL